MSWLTRWLRGTADRATPIGDLVEGKGARIVGTAEALAPLLMTPVNPQPCIGFRLFVEQGSAARPRDGWWAMLRRQACPSFAVRDDTGIAIVERPVILAIDVDDGGWAGVPPEVYALLDEEKIAPRLSDEAYDLRFSMRVLKPGDRISVEGQATLQIDPTVAAPNLRGAPQAWHFRTVKGCPPLVRDVDDGIP